MNQTEIKEAIAEQEAYITTRRKPKELDNPAGECELCGRKVWLRSMGTYSTTYAPDGWEGAAIFGWCARRGSKPPTSMCPGTKTRHRVKGRPFEVGLTPDRRELTR